MKAFRPRHNQPIHACLRACAGLMLLAMILAALVPTGFMPSFGNGGKVAIVICSGMGSKTIMVDAADYAPAADHQQDDTDQSACPYFLAQVPVTTDHGVLPAPAPWPVTSVSFLPAHDAPREFLTLPAPPARGPPAVTFA